jgi:membrane-bound lytic murein transglycosylase D
VSDTVTVDYAIDLRLVADVTGASLQEIVALNPSLLRMNTPGDMLFDLHIPVGTEDTFDSRIKDIPEAKRSSWRFHVVRDGETLDSVAADMHAHAHDIAEANEIKAGDPVDAGDELIIPVASAAAIAGPRRYTVRHGDTLITVADRFGVSVEELRRWNQLSSNAVKPGRSLTVAEPVKLAPHGRTRGSSHSGSKHSKAKSSSPGKSSTSNSSVKKKTVASKTKQKATH